MTNSFQSAPQPERIRLTISMTNHSSRKLSNYSTRESVNKGRARPSGAPQQQAYESKQIDEAGAEDAGANGQDSGRARAENRRNKRGRRESESDGKRRGRHHRDQDR